MLESAEDIQHIEQDWVGRLERVLEMRKAGGIAVQPLADTAMEYRKLAVAEQQPAVNTAAGYIAAGHRDERVAAENIVRQSAVDTAGMRLAVCTAKLLVVHTAVHTAVRNNPAARLAAGKLADEPGYTE